MKNIRVKVVIFLVVILTIAFFWGGNKEVVPISPDEIHQDAGVIEDVEYIDENKVQPEEVEETIEQIQEDEDKSTVLIEEIPEVDKSIEKQVDKENLDFKEKEVIQDKIEEIEVKIEEKDKEDKELKEKIITEDNKNNDKKDKYLTDPVPDGKPMPVEWQDVTVNKEKELSVTLSVTCKSILNNMNMFNMDKLQVLPEDGIIYATKTVTFYEGESVFDVLLREMKANKIHMEFVMTPIYNSNYISGINNLYEFDCGELSGWMYRVNGWFPNYGASRYLLKDGDKIEWIYTCDLGRDIGGDSAVTGGGE